MDSIYVLNEGSWLAFPYFDANPGMPSICETLPNGSAGCSFDVTGSATKHKMVIDKSTGEIDLKRSLNGIFGRASRKRSNGGYYHLVPTERRE